MTNADSIDPVLYRNAMSRYAGHVQIVTTAHGPERRGVTVTAACSISDHPASVLVCVNAGNPSNALFEESGRFALNTLAAHHKPLAEAFAGIGKLPVEERFARAEWIALATGAPVLADALAVFDCSLVEAKVVATHTILIGRVEALHFGPLNPALIYFERAFKAL
ncbi:flavin reductase family protein [Rhizobiaceae bacterium BDR2-2]|uniref:Flavin reductase family protein n=1 Tax=Ectorhizobium quercum TaxID=2965071 RepID=A0AAE3SVL6_9HYPH|nr:flavin reductase family protein [Ectorhizobium quercum]MCX8997808.1 flavin reductase family protein [Ectorhizobium quercum]